MIEVLPTPSVVDENRMKNEMRKMIGFCYTYHHQETKLGSCACYSSFPQSVHH